MSDQILAALEAAKEIISTFAAGSKEEQHTITQLQDAITERKNENTKVDEEFFVKDAEQAYKAAIQFLNRTGKLVWAAETTHVNRSVVGWIVEITGKTFIGVVIINFNGTVNSVIDVTKKRAKP